MEEKRRDVEIWTDGACIHNGTLKARATWAFIAHSTSHSTLRDEPSGSDSKSSGQAKDYEKAGLVEGKQTNNIAEALAIYHGLKWAADKGYRKIKLHTDSQISLFGLKKPPHLVKANREIFEKIAEVIVKHGLHVEYVKVLGHSGDPNNDRVDKLANDLARK